MSALLLSFLSAGMQYLCSIALILVCALAGSHLYVMHKRKTDKPNQTAAPSEEENGEEISEEMAGGEEISKQRKEEESDERAGETEMVALPLPEAAFMRGVYNKSFTAKLMQSSDLTKQYYADLANELLAYRKVRNRISWANSSFHVGRKAVAKFCIRGKTLYLYLALEPKEFSDSKYFITDESAVKRYEAVPLRMKVKSKRGVKFGKELIGILMQQLGAARSAGETECVKPTDFPYDTTENLLARGLIKCKTGDEQPSADEDGLKEEIERREQVTAAEAHGLISDEVAISFIEETEETEEAVLPRPKGIINIDTLSQNYQANDTVTLQSLKEKKLVGNSVNHVKVLARGVLDKPLIVKMPEFSVDAVKMILLTGGKAIKLETQKE